MNLGLNRIAVFGAGSIGAYLGGRLIDHAHVTLIGRARIGQAIATHGLKLSALDGTEIHHAPSRVQFTQSAEAASTASLVLITVKSAATEEAGRALAPFLSEGTCVISFQNGLRNTDLLREALPHCHVLAGMVPYNVAHRGAAHFHQGSSGQLMVQSDKALQPFLPTFNAAGIPLQCRKDMREVQAGKLLLNLNNALNALADIPLRDQISDRNWRRCLALAQSEALAVFRAASISPAKVTPLPCAWLPYLMRLPTPIFTRVAGRMLKIDPHARSSMWDDLQAGRATEIDVIQGEIVRLGKHFNIPTPINTQLVHHVRHAETARQAWSAVEMLNTLRKALSRSA